MLKRARKKLAALVAIALMVPVLHSAPASALVGAGDLIQNHTFDNGVGLPWTVVVTAPAAADFDISNGKYNITITNKGTNRWDVQFRHRGLVIEQGHTYTVKFTVTSTKDCMIYPKIGDQGDPYNEYWNYNKNWDKVQLRANTPVTVTQQFTMTSPTARTCEFAFHLGGDCATSALPYTLSFDDIYVSDPQFAGYPDPIPEPTNAIRVNQLGYFPNMEKQATLVSSSTTPVAWNLVDSTGKVVKTGNTTVKGLDHASGDYVHIIDFSDYTTPGTGYKLTVARGDTTPPESMPFDIATNMYTKMKYDAIKYFYHNRSGIEIKMPYCDRADLARPAGHPSDIMTPDPNDTYKGNVSLDLTGGWYDAGDHGKYLVNGGISTWTMMNQYERALYDGDVTAAPIADGTMNIPESGNGLPDILDESRWSLEMLLKMQVPAGQPLAGMAFHKGHDVAWTALGIRPDQDTQVRYLKPPSTAATLNLAAIAAQGSRLWKQYDSTFATKCLTVAETAWNAAVANPAIYAPLESGPGGGAYGDNYVLDDFYWAACELYVTTGKDVYLNYIKSSPHYLQMPTSLTGGEDLGLTGCFDWGNTAGLGTISLALVPNQLPATEVATAKANIEKAADTFIANEASEGYGSPFKESKLSDTLSGYPWGSNSFIANEAIVMAYAYDFTKNVKYINGAAEAMDYLLGRNPMVQSYVTGYGENPLENPHHRFWAYQADNTFPKAPGGCLSGGPNSGLQDPWVKGSGWKPGSRPAEKCFMDNIESWSTNEITINWNAPLAWMSAYMDAEGPKVGSGVINPVIYGDANKDGQVNALDYAALKVYLLTQNASAIDLQAADVNADGTVDAIDIALVKSYILQIIQKFPAQG